MRETVRPDLGNLEEGLPPRPLVLLHSGWSVCSNLRSPLLPHENPWWNTRKIIDDRVDYELHYTLHSGARIIEETQDAMRSHRILS